MTREDQPGSEQAEEAEQPEQPEPDWVRRKRLAAVFGDLLPEEPDAGKGDPGKGDDWYRDQVPPHHG